MACTCVFGVRSYTSYGRHFTKPEHMRKLCKRLVPFLLPGDTVVDFSCGSNEFVPLLKRLCAEDGWVRCRSLSLCLVLHAMSPIAKRLFLCYDEECALNLVAPCYLLHVWPYMKIESCV